MTTAASSATGRDYSGVSTAQLVEVYERHTNFTDIGLLAEVTGMDEGNLKKILVDQKYPWTGLHIADTILLGIGQDIEVLAHHGEITIVPGAAKFKGAEKMVADTQWLLETSGSAPMDDDEVAARIAELTTLRETLCATSDKQREILERDAARIKARQARKA